MYVYFAQSEDSHHPRIVLRKPRIQALRRKSGDCTTTIAQTAPAVQLGWFAPARHDGTGFLYHAAKPGLQNYCSMTNGIVRATFPLHIRSSRPNPLKTTENRVESGQANK